MFEINELIEFHHESEYLDFKREEYNEQNKPNLIKDVLAFANAHSVGDKYIIIGVDKKADGTQLFDILPKLDSANIQQYIHENIVPEIDIAYFPYDYKGHNLMVLQLRDPSDRPYFTSKNVAFKKGTVLLKENECWIRKGSYQMSASRADFEKIYNSRKADEGGRQAKVTFADGSDLMTALPKFKRLTTRYLKIKNASMDHSPLAEKIGPSMSSRVFAYTFNSEELYNQSYFPFKLIVHNTGLTPIEDYKLLFELVGEIQDVARTNYVSGGIPKVININNVSPSTLKLDGGGFSGKMIPHSATLVGDDSFISEDVYVKPFSDCSNITVKWKLISRDYKQHGELRIAVKPEIIEQHKDIISRKEVERTETGEMEDHIADIK